MLHVLWNFLPPHQHLTHRFGSEQLCHIGSSDEKLKVRSEASCPGVCHSHVDTKVHHASINSVLVTAIPILILYPLLPDVQLGSLESHGGNCIAEKAQPDL